MNFRKLGNTSLYPTEIGLGTWPLGGSVQAGKEAIGRGDISESKAIETIHAAIDHGINFFDTADIYGLGRSESILGKVFKGRWDNVLIASKVGKQIGSDGTIRPNFSSSYIYRAVESSLKRLKKDAIDLLQLHNPSPEIVKNEDLINCLEKLKQGGKIRYWGVSARLISDAVRMIDDGFPGSSMQIVFNLLRQEAADQLFTRINNLGVGVIVRVPLEYGLLTGKFSENSTFNTNDHRHRALEPRLSQEIARLKLIIKLCDFNEKDLPQTAIRFCLSFPEVHSVIPGASSPEQVIQNALAAPMGVLPQKTIHLLRKIYTNNFNEHCVAGSHKLM